MKQYIPCVVILLFVTVAVFVIYKAFETGRQAHVSYMLPDGSALTVDIGESASTDIITLMEALFDPVHKDDIMALVKQRYGLMKVDGSATDLLPTIENISYQSDLAKGLRDMRDTLRGPFQIVPRRVHIIVTSNEYLPDDTAAVCANGELYKQTLLLSLDNGGGLLKVGAWSKHIDESCVKRFDNDYVPLVQINMTTARKLLPKEPFVKPDYGYATVIPTGLLVEEPESTAFHNTSLDYHAFNN